VTAVFKALWYRHQALTEIGVDDYMTKPVRMDELLARLERLTRPED
jgi:DNA-binding response OmpR family regulator